MILVHGSMTHLYQITSHLLQASVNLDSTPFYIILTKFRLVETYFGKGVWYRENSYKEMIYVLQIE